jgi:hypothetical protein
MQTILRSRSGRLSRQALAHIYLSALPSVHKTSKIAEVFAPKYPVSHKDKHTGYSAATDTSSGTAMDIPTVSPLLVSLQMGPTSCRALGTRRSEYGMRGQARRS